jgi:hypothetical protein
MVINTEAKVLNIDSNSTNSTQTIVNACNEYLLSVVEQNMLIITIIILITMIKYG